MKKIISLFLSITIIGVSVITYVQEPIIAKAEEKNIQSFINETVELIKENDADKELVAENEEKIETAAYEHSVNEIESTTFQTCRLIVKSDISPDKLNSIGIASGFSDYYIVQFENEEDTKNAFSFYSECDYVEDVFCDRVFKKLSDYTVSENHQINYPEEIPERLDSWGSKVTGTYELKDFIEYEYIETELPEIKVAILDSGVDLDHEFFQGRLIETHFNASGEGIANSEIDKEESHGTNVTSVIVDNTFKNVKIANYKISHKGNGSFSGFVSGMLQATLDGADIINTSFSIWGTSKEEQTLAESVVETAIENGCIIVSSSGNYNVDIDYEYSVPTSINGVISVAASNTVNCPTSWSSRGDSVSVMAPGENIPVASPNDKYELTSGTSFSSPLTVSLYALLKTLYPNENNEQLQVRIESTADKCDLEGVVNMYGYGIIDAIGAAGLKRTKTPMIYNEYEIYEGKAEIEISVPENAVVYYTMDQTYPSKDNGILYDKENPIVIEDDFFIIHAVAYSDDGFRSDYVSDLVKAATLGTDDMFDVDESGNIIAYYGNVNYLKIPDIIDGIAVTGFTERLFSNAKFHAVWFSDNITTITSDLFYDNSSLQFADGTGIKEIHKNAFRNCINLYKINFPNVLSIGKRAFYNTKQLSGINFPQCTYIDQYAFYNSLIRYINLPKVEIICAYAFNKCELIYKLNIPMLVELRERLASSDNTYYGSAYSFWDSGINTVVDLKNITSMSYGCFYKSRVKRLEFSNIKTTESLPITYCKQPLYGTIIVALPSTLENCVIDDIPPEDRNLTYKINYKVYGTTGTYAENWAKSNNYEFVAISKENPNDAIINDLPKHYYSYMRPLEADVIGFNRTYQWYGSNTDNNTSGIAINGATERKFDPNEYKQYKYYYCVVTSTDIGYEPIEIRTGVTENKSYVLSEELADYTVLDKVISQIPEDLSVYTDESIATLKSIEESINRDLDITNQEQVDKWANELAEAVEKLELKHADYTELERTLATIPKDLSVYTEESVSALQEIISNIDYSLNITQQEQVDEYVGKVNEAIRNLKKECWFVRFLKRLLVFFNQIIIKINIIFI